MAINKSGDEYEQEADRIAAQVSGPPQPSAVNAAPPRIRQLSVPFVEDVDIEATSVGQALATPGRPLEPGVRKDMEQRFFQDFSGVRVHTGRAAEESVREAGAVAYTAGPDIVFGAGQYAPGTAMGKKLLSHELTHVVQQRGRIGQLVQRQTGGAQTPPAKTLESLEVVAQRIARLAIGPSSAAVNLEGGPGPVVSVIRNVKTGQLYVGLNTGTPARTTKVIAQAIEAQKQRIAAGEVKVVHTAVDVVGGHAEVNAMNQAVRDAEVALSRTMTEQEINATFEMHNVWLRGNRKLTTAPRCEHCKAITRGVRVTSSLFKSEGGVSGEINVPLRGKAVLKGGRAVEAEAIHGEISTAKPPVKPPTVSERVPVERAPVTAPEVTGPGIPSVGKSALRLAITEIGLNVLLFAVTYYLNKWHAEKQVRKFNNDLKDLLPRINALLKNKENEISAKVSAFPLVYGNITIGYTHDKYEPEDYNAGSMRIQDVAISHQNYQTPERQISPYTPYPMEDPSYSLTFSVPLFEEKAAEKGASSSVRNYRELRETLTDPAYKVRLMTVLTLYKLVTQDSSLQTLVVRDLLGMLKDEHALVRRAAAFSLSRLKAKIAILYIQQLIPVTSDDRDKELFQGYLRELEKR